MITNDQIAERVSEVVNAFVKENKSTAEELATIRAVATLAANLLQNINTIALAGRTASATPIKTYVDKQGPFEGKQPKNVCDPLMATTSALVRDFEAIKLARMTDLLRRVIANPENVGEVAKAIAVDWCPAWEINALGNVSIKVPRH